MSEKPESNGPPPPLPETPARPPTPTEATTHTTHLSNGARLSRVLPMPPPPVASAMPLTLIPGTPLPPPPPPPPPPNALSLKAEPTIKSEPVDNEFQSGQMRIICRDYIRGICIRDGKCRYLHDFDHRQFKDLLMFCHDFQNKGCSRPNCKFIHATISEEQAFYKTIKLPHSNLEKNRNGEMQNFPSTSIDMNIITRLPPPQFTSNHTVSHNATAPIHFSQGAGMDTPFRPPANLSRPPPGVPNWNNYGPNGPPTIPPPPPNENFTRPPVHNLHPMSYCPPTNQPPPTAVMQDHSWSTPSQQPPIMNDTDRNMKRKRSESEESLNIRQSIPRLEFMGPCPNCKVLENKLVTVKSTMDQLRKIVLEKEERRWKKEAEKQKSLLEHISSIIGSSQTQNQMMQLPALQLPQLLHLQRNPTSNDQQLMINNASSMMGSGQNWAEPSSSAQQQSMLSYGNNQVVLQVPPGRQLTPQQQQVLQLLDSNGFSISYK